MANISAAASVLFYAYLSALGFFCPFRLTFHFQNTVDVLLDNVVFLDLLFQFSIVGMPALVVNEKVVAMGKVLKAADVEKLLHKLGF